MNRRAVDMVWLQATEAVWPIMISGTPYSDAPVTLIWPGMVSWAWYNRSGPIQGKCGLPSSRPWWSRVPAEPMANALLPAVAERLVPARGQLVRGLPGAGRATAVRAVPAAFGGAAEPMPLMKGSSPFSSISW